MRDVGQQRAERDEELDPEVACEVDDEPRERAPAEVRLHAEEQHRIAVHSLRARVVEDRLRPVDSPRVTVLQPDLRPRRLEVEEALRVDLGESLRVPGLREVAGGERGALPSVVPAAEGRDQHRPLERGTVLDIQLSH